MLNPRITIKMKDGFIFNLGAGLHFTLFRNSSTLPTDKLEFSINPIDIGFKNLIGASVELRTGVRELDIGSYFLSKKKVQRFKTDTEGFWKEDIEFMGIVTAVSIASPQATSGSRPRGLFSPLNVVCEDILRYFFNSSSRLYSSEKAKDLTLHGHLVNAVRAWKSGIRKADPSIEFEIFNDMNFFVFHKFSTDAFIKSGTGTFDRVFRTLAYKDRSFIISRPSGGVITVPMYIDSAYSFLKGGDSRFAYKDAKSLLGGSGYASIDDINVYSVIINESDVLSVSASYNHTQRLGVASLLFKVVEKENDSPITRKDIEEASFKPTHLTKDEAEVESLSYFIVSGAGDDRKYKEAKNAVAGMRKSHSFDSFKLRVEVSVDVFLGSSSLKEVAKNTAKDLLSVVDGGISDELLSFTRLRVPVVGQHVLLNLKKIHVQPSSLQESNIRYAVSSGDFKNGIKRVEETLGSSDGYDILDALGISWTKKRVFTITSLSWNYPKNTVILYLADPFKFAPSN